MDKKRAAKAKIAKDPEDVELSDPELREIENMKSDDELASLERSGSVDLEALERELNQLEDEEVKIPQATPAEQIEGEFHGPELFFGDILEQELETVLPALKKSCEEREELVDFVTALNKKELELFKLKRAVLEKAAAGELDERKYLAALEKTFERNKLIFDKAATRRLPPEHIQRVKKRVDTIKEEIETIKKAIAEEEQAPPVADPKTPVKTAHVSEIMKKSDSKNVIEKSGARDTSPAMRKDSHSSHPTLLHFAQKISFHMCFLDHLKKYCAVDRAKDIETLETKIVNMKEKLEKLKSDPTKDSIEALDKTFPQLEPSFIIGMERTERNKKIEAIITQIQGDIKTVKTPAMIEIFKNHYVPLIKKLVEARDSPTAALPAVTKKAFPVPTNEVNKSIASGELLLRVAKITNILPKRYFSLQIDFKYEGHQVSEKTPYCENGGQLNYQRKFILDSGKLMRRFAGEKMFFTLHKKNFLIGSRVVSTTALPLDKLRNYHTVPHRLEFDYKNNSKIYAEVEVAVHKALEKPMKDIYLYVIERQVPAFTISSTKPRDSFAVAQPPRSIPQVPIKTPVLTPMQSSERNSSRTADKQPFSTLQAPTRVELPAPKRHTLAPPTSVQSPDPIEQLEKMTFRFPVLRPPQKKALTQLVAQNSLPPIYLNYQENIFCVSFLEEFSKEIEQQINQFAVQGDSESRKEAEQLLITATKYLNYLTDQIQSEKMSTADYKQKIDRFIQLDEANLPFYEKHGFKDSVTFIRNRLQLMKTESAQLEVLLKEQAG